MTSACWRIKGKAKPVTTTIEVMKRPRSMAGLVSYSLEKSSEPQCANSVLGTGASTKMSAVRYDELPWSI